MSAPLAYFISFRTYGTFLHGDERGAVDRWHNIHNTPTLPPDPIREAANARRMRWPPFVMTPSQRAVVDKTVREVCAKRAWDILALNVRTNHVHVVLAAAAHTPERIMNDLKAWSTRRLREAGEVTTERALWEEHGSTPHLYESDDLLAAVDYVLTRQDRAK